MLRQRTPGGIRVQFCSDQMSLLRREALQKNGFGPKLNDYQVPFLVPRHMSRLDVRAYLEAYYGVRVLDVSIINRVEQQKRDEYTRLYYIRAQKRAIVTLADKFVYPEPALLPKERDEAEQKELQKQIAKVDMQAALRRGARDIEEVETRDTMPIGERKRKLLEQARSLSQLVKST
jgi:ribosomal protein L23